MVGSKAAAANWTLEEVKAQIEGLENVAIKRAKDVLAKLPGTVETDDVLAALDLVSEVVRADFDSSEDYQDARMEAWEDFKAEVDLLEEEEDEVEEDEESEAEVEVEEEKPEASHIQPTKYAQKPPAKSGPTSIATQSSESETPLRDLVQPVPKRGQKPLPEAELIKEGKKRVAGMKAAGISKAEMEAEIKRFNAENEELKAELESAKQAAMLKRDKAAAKRTEKPVKLAMVRLEMVNSADSRLEEALEKLGFMMHLNGYIEVPVDIILNGLRTEYGVRIGDKVEVDTKVQPKIQRERPEASKRSELRSDDKRLQLSDERKAEIANRLWSARAGKYGLSIEELKSLHLRAGVAPSAEQLAEIEKARKFVKVSAREIPEVDPKPKAKSKR